MIARLAGVTTRATAAGSYLVPRADVQLSFAFTSSPGVPLQANWNVPARLKRQSGGRFCVRGTTERPPK